MNRWQIKNLNDYSKKEGAFLDTIKELSNKQIDNLGLRKLYNQITQSKTGNVDLESSKVVVNQNGTELEIMITGYIYDFTLNNVQFVIEEYRKENGESPESLLVRINSGGGSAFAGMAIYNYLSSYKGKVTTIIDGLAASAAATIFMAGEERLIHNNMITFMIHRAMSYIDIFEFGNSEYLKTVDVQREKDQVLQLLNVLDSDLIDLYTDKTTLTKKQVVDYMAKEYFFNKNEMTKFGIATGIYEKDDDEKDEENKSETKDRSTVNNDSVDPAKNSRPKGETPSNDSELIANSLFLLAQ